MHLSNKKELSTSFLEPGWKGQTFKGCVANNSSWQVTVTSRFHSGTSCSQRVWEKKKGEGKKKTRILLYTPCGDVCACRIHRIFPILVKRTSQRTLRSFIVNTEMWKLIIKSIWSWEELHPTQLAVQGFHHYLTVFIFKKLSLNTGKVSLHMNALRTHTYLAV